MTSLAVYARSLMKFIEPHLPAKNEEEVKGYINGIRLNILCFVW